jgi:hypothetical protein
MVTSTPGRTASMARYGAHVDQLLRETPKITAARIAQVIRQTIDPTFCVSERSAREYVASRRARLVPKEAFVRLVYSPGEHYVEYRVMLSPAQTLFVFEPPRAVRLSIITPHCPARSDHPEKRIDVYY